MERMVFLRTAWMKHYNGVTKDDLPVNGGSYVEQNRNGGEVYNFRSVKGRHYGYAQVSPSGRIDLKRIDPSASDGRLDDVLVVWLARDDRQDATVIIGWYRAATLYSGWQERPKGALPRVVGGFNSYIVKASVDDSRLLDSMERTFRVHRARRGQSGFGQSLIWYADAPGDAPIRRDALEYIAGVEKRKGRGATTNHGIRPRSEGRWKPIPAERRRQIEHAAMKRVKQWLEDELGYMTVDVSKENLGWDITATQRDTTLRVEVKGLSGGTACVELTPNEYRAMLRHRREYCLCIVSNALDKDGRRLRSVRWDAVSSDWRSEDSATPARLFELTGCRVELDELSIGQ
ncbi:MAG: DUF3883 domain-containing protein [Phycisphaerales bacterium]|nr:DUF3883 domain-containing protein [Phycisphaerales bacterium]